jgi:FemAB-related protein (PEP-CTERM system-associated)
MIVSTLERGEEAEWDAFVERSPEATFFHLSGWRDVIEQAFAHKTFYLSARRGGSICGVLPLTQVKSSLFGNTLIANAFCVHGGIVAMDDETEGALRARAVEMARALGVGCIELRSAHQSPGWQTRNDRYATFRRPIEPDSEKNLKAIPRKQRAVVRKAISSGLRSDIDDTTDRLHHIYAASVRRLGTPVFSRRYFRLLKERFGPACDVLTVTAADQPIASVLNFYFRDEVLPYYGGGLEVARSLGGNDFLYWEVMRRAAERGFRVFDFGRSKVDTGAYYFKRNWGFEPTPLCYEFLPIRDRHIPDVNPLNPKYRIAVSLWRRLPLAVTKVLGPPIVRCIG